MKNHSPSQLITVLFLLGGVNLISSPANSQADSACFMVNDDGKVIDLGNLCTGENSRVMEAQIKRRDRGIPVIDVTFNGRTFEMLFDTGASGTSITPQMARALEVAPEGTTLVDTAGGTIRVTTARVSSVTAGGVVANNLLVTINPSLPIGLLGQDLFGNYDITIKQDVVEFNPR
ncbi:retroviral-like aspartic protease family protein [Lyngbya aestuarii]|uniref:retroviral-like aspartic protease family protein n=1 Tax=Lyngbya aestuarii TaxID=118322 RepID=UPI00403DFB74